MMALQVYESPPPLAIDTSRPTQNPSPSRHKMRSMCAWLWTEPSATCLSRTAAWSIPRALKSVTMASPGVLRQQFPDLRGPIARSARAITTGHARAWQATQASTAQVRHCLVVRTVTTTPTVRGVLTTVETRQDTVIRTTQGRALAAVSSRARPKMVFTHAKLWTTVWALLLDIVIGKARLSTEIMGVTVLVANATVSLPLPPAPIASPRARSPSSTSRLPRRVCNLPKHVPRL